MQYKLAGLCSCTSGGEANEQGAGDTMEDVEPSIPVAVLLIVINHRHCQYQEQASRNLSTQEA